MSTTKPTFTTDAGGFIPSEEAQRLRDNYVNKKRKQYPDNDFIQAYFFGKDKLQALLDCQEDIIGLRIYFGDDHDNDDTEFKKMVIYAVNSDGHNVLINSNPSTNGNLRSAAATGSALDAGLPCPTNCPDADTK